MEEQDVCSIHICPILGRTVMFEDDECTEICFDKDCPIVKNNDGGLNERSFYSGQRRK